LPQAFLSADAVLRLALNVANGLVVNAEVIKTNVDRTLPYMATENIMMAAVAAGRDRQEVHECVRRHSHAVTAALKGGAARNDLLDRLRADPALAGVDFDRVLAESRFIGRAPQQVDEFLAEVIAPIRARYAGALRQTAEVSV
jgi:adenylosuccinate lyase